MIKAEFKEEVKKSLKDPRTMTVIAYKLGVSHPMLSGWIRYNSKKMYLYSTLKVISETINIPIEKLVNLTAV